MTDPSVAVVARPQGPASDRGDRALVRHLLTLTPTERLLTLSSFWPVVRIGLQRRHVAGGAHRP
ncbi:MAG: hypothetical protein KY460_02900 [Actinobacteria bacterium]|nr:hypothetical protein [Actinomycetota bacterium]